MRLSTREAKERECLGTRLHKYGAYMIGFSGIIGEHKILNKKPPHDEKPQILLEWLYEEQCHNSLNIFCDVSE